MAWDTCLAPSTTTTTAAAAAAATCLYNCSIIPADGLVMQGAKASTDMVLPQSAQNIMLPVGEWLTLCKQNFIKFSLGTGNESKSHAKSIWKYICFFYHFQHWDGNRKGRIPSSWQSSKLAGSPKSEASEIMLWTSETILALVRSD